MEKIFVFGSNLQGFHGAGSAGLAFRGTPANTWRTDPLFLKALHAHPSSPDKIGKLAVFGIAKGLQHGHDGSSYAIVTVTKPGAKRSIPLANIRSQICDLINFAKNNPQLVFTCSPFGCGFAGYSPHEMENVWLQAMSCEGGLPPNLNPPNYHKPGELKD